MKNVIYKIRNTTNNKFYVGSTIDTETRFKTHRRKLRTGKHQSPHMQAAWNKYGEDCFKFEVVERLDNPEGLLAAEQVWLDEHAGKDHCYNWATDASAPMRGKKHTPEVVLKLIEAGQRVPKGEDSVLYGVPRSDETRALISAKCLGLPNPMKGKQHSVTATANISAAVKRGEDSHFYGKRPANADDLQKAIHATLPDRTTKVFDSLTLMRDTLGVAIGTIIRVCKSGKPVSRGPIAGWTLSYEGGSINEAPHIPEEFADLPRTRQDAKLINAPLYFTGLPCSRGHISPKKLKGSCVACCKEDYKKYNDRKKK